MYGIEIGTIDDIDKGLLDVYYEGYNFHCNGRPDIFDNKSIEEIRKELIKEFEDENKKLIVIHKDNKVIGFTIYQIKNAHAKVLYIDQLIITKKQTRKGFGKLLLNELERIAVREKCKRIEFTCWTFNTNALDMYKHLNFKEQLIKFEKDV